jgi:hypothetical protein
MVLWFLGLTPRQRRRLQELKTTQRGWAIYTGAIAVTLFIAGRVATSHGMVAGFAVMLLVLWPPQAAWLHWSDAGPASTPQAE